RPGWSLLRERAVNDDLSPRFVTLPALQLGGLLCDLRVIDPDDTSQGVHDELGHVVDVSSLTCFAEEPSEDSEVGLAIWASPTTSSLPEGPDDTLFCRSRRPGGVVPSSTAGEPSTRLAGWVTGNGEPGNDVDVEDLSLQRECERPVTALLLDQITPPHRRCSSCLETPPGASGDHR